VNIIMKASAGDIVLLVLGVLVMALLLLLGALSQNWVAFPCFLGVAVVYHTWLWQLIQVIQRQAGIDLDDVPEDDDDEDIFPSA
jgi:hypothetical protein